MLRGKIISTPENWKQTSSEMKKKKKKKRAPQKNKKVTRNQTLQQKSH